MEKKIYTQPETSVCKAASEAFLDNPTGIKTTSPGSGDADNARSKDKQFWEDEDFDETNSGKNVWND